mgnify:CR=1 FL=1
MPNEKGNKAECNNHNNNQNGNKLSIRQKKGRTDDKNWLDSREKRLFKASNKNRNRKEKGKKYNVSGSFRQEG